MVASSQFELQAALAAAGPQPAVEVSPRHVNGWQWSPAITHQCTNVLDRRRAPAAANAIS